MTNNNETMTPETPGIPESSEPTNAQAAAPEAPASWDSLGLSDEMLALVRKAGFSTPTPVQSKAIPLGLDGCDVIASAQTGTGKTAAFAFPMIEKFAGRDGTYGLVLAPTREIANQIQETIEIFGKPRGIRSIVMIGGVDYRKDEEGLATYPHIIVATPGRLCDHLERGNIWLEFIEVFVLDEADRMLDMGFAAQLNQISNAISKNRQTLMFSATFPPAVEKLARSIMHEPERVTIGIPLSAAKTVEQKLIWVSPNSKERELKKLLARFEGPIIIFTRTKNEAVRLWRSLHASGVHDIQYISSDRQQKHREQALAQFRSGEVRILIATDVAGRGIHVDNVGHVINYDLPMEPEDYIHRIGRTGRAEALGNAVSFVTQRDRGILGQIERLLKKPIPAEYANSYRDDDRGDSRGDSRGDRGGSRGGRGGDRDRGGSRDGRGRSSERPQPERSQSRQAPAAAGDAAGAEPRQASGAAEPRESRDSQPRTEGASDGSSPARKKRRRRRGRGGSGKGPGAAGTPSQEG